MAPSRTTARPRPVLAALAVLGPAALAGCDGRGHPAATAVAGPDTAKAAAARPGPGPTAVPHPGVPKPDAGRFRYDAATRTLEVGDPPVPGGRWMLSTPKEPRGVPVEGAYQFPPMVDVDGVAVFYTSAHGQASQAVSLREIVEARDVR